MKNIDDFLFSTKARPAWAAFGALLLAALIFLAGMSVGARTERMERGVRVFVRGPDSAPGAFGLPFPPPGFLPGGHGVVGIVSKTGTSSILVAERDGDVEQVELTGATRILHKDGATTTVGAGDSVVIVGNPNNGRFEAILIRILR